eukprot:PhM_4_TR10337/c0_g1_i1/m.36263
MIPHGMVLLGLSIIVIFAIFLIKTRRLCPTALFDETPSSPLNMNSYVQDKLARAPCDASNPSTVALHLARLSAAKRWLDTRRSEGNVDDGVADGSAQYITRRMESSKRYLREELSSV